MAENFLLQHNEALRAQVTHKVAEIEAAAARRSGPVVDPLATLTALILDTLSARAAATGAVDGELTMQTDLVVRDQFHADLALKFPSLLKRGGPKAFAEHHATWIVETLGGPALAHAVGSVEAVGMYVNVTLRDEWLLGAVDAVVTAGPGFGHSDALAGERRLLDYSSPNVAKTLHAGHIRSTIIGDVLGNVAEAAGSIVFRVNHINDFGGFGFLLEGMRRFDDRFAAGLGTNDKALELYRLRRLLERAVAADAARDELGPDEAAAVAQYLPSASSASEIAAAFADLTAASDERFAALEAGDHDEVRLWEELVTASLADFQTFYESLAVDLDVVLGESFYAQLGLSMVEEWLTDGRAVVYSESEIAADLAAVDEMVATGKLTDAEAESARAGILKDQGAAVVRLSAVERYVVLRRDGRSIYSTRDLAAIAVRNELFHPTSCTYVVGQEQQTHFTRLFAAGYQLGLAQPEVTSFEHLSFGFYIDPTTKKKLSSRESVAGVTNLFSTAREYFVSRLSDRSDDPDDVARQLTVASIVFNDLKQDIKSAVELDVNDPTALLELFEKSGGAYVVYAACRAGAVVRKAAGQPVAPTTDPLDDDEVALVLAVLDTPRSVVGAARQRDPAVVVRHLLTLSNLYNSYYARSRVIGPDGVIATRLAVTAAVEQALRNGLALLNVDCPEAI